MDDSTDRPTLHQSPTPSVITIQVKKMVNRFWERLWEIKASIEVRPCMHADVCSACVPTLHSTRLSKRPCLTNTPSHPIPSHTCQDGVERTLEAVGLLEPPPGSQGSAAGAFWFGWCWWLKWGSS